ncbi:MAG: hypothetical protein GY777_14025, partial [Candidatus Brocadiaceae bacterium]|nr:hypothetical protein [Candidatus Brocadiaceae bacterium]
GRTDIRCPLGCRSHHKKAGARKRCSEYYQTEVGKKAKKAHNRRRYERKDTLPERPNPDVAANKDRDFMGHMDFMMSLTEGRRVGLYRIEQIYKTFFQNWRQQGLVFWQEWCKLPEQ